MNRDELRINSFLRFGYFCDYTRCRAPIDFSGIDKSRYESASNEELIEAGVEVLIKSIAGLWQEGREHVIPLTGGLDSRLILGAVLEHAPAERVQTHTYGISGSYDFEIGNAIAQNIGTRHLPIPLQDEVYSAESEIIAAKRTDCQAILFHHPPLRTLDRLYGDALFWSGYVGDAVAGSYLRERPSTSLREAQVVHLSNRVLVRSTQLHRIPDYEFLAWMRRDHIDPTLLTYDEQVLFDEAANKFTAPTILYDGYEFLTPFINTPWMDFMFSVPNRYRLGQKLMIDIGRRAFPQLFNFPSKNRLGHTFAVPDRVVRRTFWFNRIRKVAHQFFPKVNWPNFQCNDFSEGVRSNASLRRLVRHSIEDLRERGVCDWIDFDGIWRRHDRRLKNHGDALITLASLELVLKARETCGLE